MTAIHFALQPGRVVFTPNKRRVYILTFFLFLVRFVNCIQIKKDLAAPSAFTAAVVFSLINNEEERVMITITWQTNKSSSRICDNNKFFRIDYSTCSLH